MTEKRKTVEEYLAEADRMLRKVEENASDMTSLSLETETDRLQLHFIRINMTDEKYWERLWALQEYLEDRMEHEAAMRVASEQSPPDSDETHS